MRIVHIASSDSAGGAARAAYRLHQALRSIGQDSTMIVGNAQTGDPSVRSPGQMSRSRRLLAWWRNRCRGRRLSAACKGAPPGEIFSDDRPGEIIIDPAMLTGYDIVNLHWVSGLIDYQKFLPTVAARQHIIWTLHDMNPFTGGCHYDNGCDHFMNVCGDCPQLGTRGPDDLSAKTWRRKKVALAPIASGRLHAVAPSRWIAAQCAKSSLFAGVPVTVIPNCVNTGFFRPMEHEQVRSVLGIPPQAFVILVVADDLSNPRKGVTYLLEAIRNLRHLPGLFLVSLGRKAPEDIGIPSLHLGSVDNERFIALAYAAADLFVMTPIQDNLPNTVLEAMACGTPSVGFDVGGIPDMILPGQTGELVPLKDVSALVASLTHLFDDRKYVASMRPICRETALRCYSPAVQARRYVALYENMLKAK